MRFKLKLAHNCACMPTLIRSMDTLVDTIGTFRAAARKFQKYFGG
jgi:hypothetical protein